MSLCFTLFWITASLIIFKIFLKLTTKWCRSKTCLIGKTVIVTGANTGIGYETALDMAMRGARVILACRDKSKAEDAKSKIIAESGNENVAVKILDLASFKSVRDFARDINENEERLDILINNAGLIVLEDVKSEDGLNLTLQVNHLSSFLLTHLLIDLLKKTGTSRIINVSSIGAKYVKNFNPDAIDQPLGKYSAYPLTKLCNILFTRELSKRLKSTQVTTYSLHPGTIKTEVGRNLSQLVQTLFTPLVLFLKTPEEGAQTTIYTAVARGIEGFSGEHFSGCKRVDKYKSVVEGDEKKLWKKSIEMIQMKPEEIKI